LHEHKKKLESTVTLLRVFICRLAKGFTIVLDANSDLSMLLWKKSSKMLVADRAERSDSLIYHSPTPSMPPDQPAMRSGSQVVHDSLFVCSCFVWPPARSTNFVGNIGLIR
jgi:hypothetical protein